MTGDPPKERRTECQRSVASAAIEITRRAAIKRPAIPDMQRPVRARPHVGQTLKDPAHPDRFLSMRLRSHIKAHV
jgi:hypothetical protein